MPLSQEQFQKARSGGFSTEQIAGFEKRRGEETTVQAGQPQADTFQSELTVAPETLEDEFSGVFGQSAIGQTAERVAVDAVLAPMTEFARGFHTGAAELNESLGAVAGLVNQIPIVKNTGVFGIASDYMGKLAEDQRQQAASLPPTEMPSILKGVYDLMGQAPAIYSEFAAAEGALGVAQVPKLLKLAKAEQLSEAATFALVNGVKSFGEENTMASFGEGAAEGAAFSMGFSLAGKGLSLLKNFGKKTARMYVKAITGDAELASDFVRNPSKYNLNPRGKVKTPKTIKQDFDNAKMEIDLKYSMEKDAFVFKQNAEKQAFKVNLKSAELELQESLGVVKESLKSGSGISIKEAGQNATKAITDSNNTIVARTVEVFDDALVQFQSLEKEAGDRVGTAIRNISEKNPNAGVKTSAVAERFNKVVKDFSPFKATEVTKKGVSEVSFQPIDVAGDKTAGDLFTKVQKQFEEMGESGSINLEYLQSLKTNLKERASAAFGAGKNSTGTFFGKLSDAVNPAKIVGENPQVATSLKELATANKEFSTYLPKYEEALAQYFKKDSQGVWQPNVNKAINALKKGDDPVALRLMKKADSALKPQDRILPKVEEVIRPTKKIEATQKDIVDNLTKRVEQEKVALEKASKTSMRELRANQNKLRFEESTRLSKELKDFTLNADKQYTAMIQDLKKTKDFLEGQLSLRQPFVSMSRWSSPIALMQQMSALSAVGAIGGGAAGGTLGALGGGGLPLAVGLSPIVSSNVIKGGILAGRTTKKLINQAIPPATAGKILRQLVTSKATDKGNK